MLTKLSLDTLSDIAGKAAIPSYRRADLKAGILHFGIGNFHRAHQAVYLDALFGEGTDHDWAILGAGVLASDAKLRDRLKAQDYLTTVVEQEAEKSEARVTGSMIGYVEPGDPEAIVAALSDPAIRIVSIETIGW